MLEIQKIRENPEHFIQGLLKRNLTDSESSVSRILELDKERREALTSLERLRAESKKAAKSIGQLMQQGKKEEAEAAKAETSRMKSEARDLEATVESTAAEQKNLLLNLPNIPHESVPLGLTPEDNKEIFRNKIIPVLPSVVKPHWELAKELGIIDFELGAKITGSGFPVYLGKGARLLRGMLAFFMEEAEQAGYLEVIPPLMVNEASGYGTGNLPDKEGQMYHMTVDDLYMIPTAEVPITNMYRDVIADPAKFPYKNFGYTPCFRREAGAYGSHVRGLNRLHQFDKVEIVEVCHPEHSYERLEAMLAHASSLLEKLELPYRVLSLCSGDMGFTAAKTYDLEVFSGGQERWLEVSSVSNFETYQATRLKLRFKDENNVSTLCHTLNGSALAIPRVMAALIENNQTENGSVKIPAVLQHYTGFDIIEAR